MADRLREIAERATLRWFSEPNSDPSTFQRSGSQHEMADTIEAALREAVAERDKHWKALFGRGLTQQELVNWSAAAAVLSVEDFAAQITQSGRDAIREAVAEERERAVRIVREVRSVWFGPGPCDEILRRLREGR